MRHLCLPTILAFGLQTATPTVAADTMISVPSDPRATYYSVQKTALKNGNIEITTKRVGPSGTSYARREINCKKMTFRYTGEGDTLAEAKRGNANQPMTNLTPQSISTYVAKFACARK